MPGVAEHIFEFVGGKSVFSSPAGSRPARRRKKFAVPLSTTMKGYRMYRKKISGPATHRVTPSASG